MSICPPPPHLIHSGGHAFVSNLHFISAAQSLLEKRLVSGSGRSAEIRRHLGFQVCHGFWRAARAGSAR
jgi:hypothetical protein